LLFSVVFPIVKLVILLAATSSLVSMSDIARRRMHTIAMVTGKYSLLDLVVVAVMIVMVKFGQMAEVHARARDGPVRRGRSALDRSRVMRQLQKNAGEWVMNDAASTAPCQAGRAVAAVPAAALDHPGAGPAGGGTLLPIQTSSRAAT